MDFPYCKEGREEWQGTVFKNFGLAIYKCIKNFVLYDLFKSSNKSISQCDIKFTYIRTFNKNLYFLLCLIFFRFRHKNFKGFHFLLFFSMSTVNYVWLVVHISFDRYIRVWLLKFDVWRTKRPRPLMEIVFDMCYRLLWKF